MWYVHIMEYHVATKGVNPKYGTIEKSLFYMKISQATEREWAIENMLDDSTYKI